MQSPRCSDLRSSLREENAVLRATRLGWASLSNPSPRNVGGLPYGVAFYNVIIDSKHAAAIIYIHAPAHGKQWSVRNFKLRAQRT